MKVGDAITIDGVFEVVPTHRKWWQFWKPRYVPTTKLQVFTVVGSFSGKKTK